MMRSSKLKEIDEKYKNEDWYKRGQAEFERLMLEGFIVALIVVPIIMYILHRKHLL